MKEKTVREQREKIERMITEFDKYTLLPLISSHPRVCDLNSPQVSQQVQAAVRDLPNVGTLAFSYIARAYTEIPGGSKVVRRLKRPNEDDANNQPQKRRH